MSVESERVFGRNFDRFTSSSEIDGFEKYFEISNQILTMSYNFLRNSTGIEPNKKMQELGDIGFQYLARNDIELTIADAEGLEDPDFVVLGEESLRIQIPRDFIEIADSDPTEILYFAVFLGSKMRDQKLGFDLLDEDSDKRAVILQAEFLHWWEQVTKDLEIDFYPSESQDSLMNLYPDGIESVTDATLYQDLVEDARKTGRINLKDFVNFNPSPVPYIDYEN